MNSESENFLFKLFMLFVGFSDRSIQGEHISHEISIII